MQIKNEKQYNQILEQYKVYKRKSFQQELNLKGIIEYFDIKEAIKDYDSRNNRLQNKTKESPRAV